MEAADTKILETKKEEVLRYIKDAEPLMQLL
jgi:hypothetical protein